MITKFARLEVGLFTKPSKSDFLRVYQCLKRIYLVSIQKWWILVQGKAEPFSNHRHSVLFRGFENGENAALGRKTLFMDGHYFRPLFINASAMGLLKEGFGFFFFFGFGPR